MVKFMQEENKGDKIRRVLQLYAKLSDGYVINKAEEAVIMELQSVVLLEILMI